MKLKIKEGNMVGLDNGNIRNFYELDFKELNWEDKEGERVLFLLRIFWSVMKDLDNGEDGFDVNSGKLLYVDIKDWDTKDYVGFIKDNLDKVNLNEGNYRMYFNDLVGYFIEFINSDSLKKIKKVKNG
tara:strand:- start:3523 stop:3906 length:384 start_codon:yes stop_codon:yes gene_type:complete